MALANTTAAVFMSRLDGSIVLIALPAIFVGIELDPLAPGNIGYPLWMIMGYRLVQAVVVVTVGGLGDVVGRGADLQRRVRGMFAGGPPRALRSGLVHAGVPDAAAHRLAALPPTTSLFGALLGINPLHHLRASHGALHLLSMAGRRAITGRAFFPHLISAPSTTGSSAFSRPQRPARGRCGDDRARSRPRRPRRLRASRLRRGRGADRHDGAPDRGGGGAHDVPC